MRLSSQSAEQTCPWIDAGDPRCGRRFTLGHLSEAMHYCLQDPSACPVYQQIHAERHVERISLTIHGQPHRLASGLRSAAS